MSDSKWYFTEEQLANSPSRKCGMNAEQELSYRQRAANLIQEIGQRLQVSQLCINTAIVYMHRFYAFHSFTMFHRDSIAAAAFFLAAKVEEQPRKLEHVIKILNICLEKNDNTRESYAEQAQELVFNENVLLQTLGFDVAIDHPHTYVVKACQLFNIVTVSRELRQTCYFMASNSLHLTTMCLKYRPTVVAAFCIYIACTWSGWQIPDSSEGKPWYSYVDKSVNPDILKKLTDEYLQILERSPSKFKSKMKAITSNRQATGTEANKNSTNARDETPSTSAYHKNQHNDKQRPHHHHHHRHHTNSTSSNSGANSNNKKQAPEDTHVNASTSSAAASTASKPATQQQQPSIPSSQMQSSSSTYKNQQQPPLPANGASSSSSSNVQRQRPPSSQKLGMPDERSQQRQLHHENAYNNSSSSRPTDPNKQRMSTSQPPLPSVSSQQQQQPPPPPPSSSSSQIKTASSFDQRHAQQSSSQKSSTVDYQQKKHPIPGNSTSDYHNRSSSQPQPLPLSQGQQQSSHKKPSWPGQSSTSSSSQQQNAPKPSHSSSSQPSPLNDSWYERPNQQQTKAPSPPRQSKSMFSPSPEHDMFEKNKYMMMTNFKDSPKSDKSHQDHRSSTPNKRERRPEMATTPTSQKSSSQNDRKPMIKTENQLPNHLAQPLIPDSGMRQQKRSIASLDDAMTSDTNRDSKVIKLEPVKSEPILSMSNSRSSTQLYGSSSDAITLPTPSMKQPIETNPDIVKSLLKECYTTSKFDSMDSPLDVINPEPPEQLLADPPSLIHQAQAKSLFDSDSLMESTLNDSAKELGTDEERSKKNKSKKKKEKHKHKDRTKEKDHKEHKKHKKDRHKERDDHSHSSTPLKIILSMDKTDTKSSPESLNTSAFKIKLPLKPEMTVGMSNQQQLPPAPLKLKISKEKIGFSNSTQNLSDAASTTSTTHKKKDKDKEKSHKKSKHGNNNNVDAVSLASSQNVQSMPSYQPPPPQQSQMNKMPQQQPAPSSFSYQAPEQMNTMNMFPFNQQQQQQQQQPTVGDGHFMNPMMQQQFQSMFNNYNEYQQQQAVSYMGRMASSKK